jgi:hypothetical protein
VLICTAGLHRTLPLIQITALAEGDARTAAQGLVRAAAAKDPSISITAVLVDLPTPPTPTPTRRVSVRLPRLT